MKVFCTLFFILIFALSYAQDSIPKSELPVKLIQQDGKIKVVPFATVEKVPVYMGCEEQLSNEELKKCMSDKITLFIHKKFNPNVAKRLKLNKKDVRITVLFKINEHGDIENIMARGPHPKLEQEAIRVVKSLPKMSKPGMQDGKPVIVPYMLPILITQKKRSSN